MRNHEMKQKKSARHLGETHNNKSTAFSAHSFTSTGIRILNVQITNVSFTLGKLTTIGDTKTETFSVAINNYLSLIHI